MFNFFKKLTSNKEKIWSFSGGIHPHEMKIQSSQVPLVTLPLADELIIPIQQHVGSAGDIIVKTNDYLLKGQALTKGCDRRIPVHAPTSGTITDIAPHITANPSGLKELCIRLQPDSKDQWCERKPLPNYLQYSTKVLLSHIEQAGIAGLGGAGFPTATKLKNGNKLINTLIINAAECEPYITADDRLMQEHADEIIEGILILIHILKPKEVLIGIEDNKRAAIAALKEALLGQQAMIKLRVIPTKYPSGGAKQLTKILTGKEIPSGVHSSFIGILMQNIGTVFAIKRAIIDGEPLIERVVTLTGDAIQKPGNYWVRLGTPINFLLQQVGLVPQSEQMVIMGGPLMGFTLSDLTTPIVKISNCILAPTIAEIGEPNIEEACIRCGLCTQACPANLLPQQLYWFSRGQEHEKAEQYNLSDCIECGACAYVCPSNIPLVRYYRQEKAEIKAITEEKQRRWDAKQRFEAKKSRLEREKILRQQRHNQAAVKPEETEKAAINAQKNQADNSRTESLNNQAAIEARQARKAQLRAIQATRQAAESQSAVTTEIISEPQPPDPRKAAVAAAIARVKAKKAAESQSVVKTEIISEPQPADPCKAAVSAAIARAKPKRDAQSKTP
ncbi:electron transport complex subunit RsxC [Arsenophonus endosymbiont of Bemisia tabaci]|uniref:electron transport complex subunit RsxC n=1 Tax=Arsenophonus endosymbiont of Bemisia tabaci TaxID=536059 RepID=UPI0015F56435|nr:electron transport complex subunit RsxC [Arsenophonus endosymbiont of Bemisia tabaci]CAA2929628.1 Electron transport complex subunit RsxC [Arsenophonus endosymbiont of Bemisia tabaci Q2]